MEPKTSSLIAYGAIETRAAEMAHQMAKECASERLLLVGLLNGAAPFLMALVRHWPATLQAALLSLIHISEPTRLLSSADAGVGL